VGLKGKRNEGDFNEYPEELKEDYLYLSGWINELAQKYGEKIRIEVIDARTLRGFYKSIRYRTQTYPTFIVNRREKYTDPDKTQLDLIIQSHLG
jgi:hypothetical protein